MRRFAATLFVALAAASAAVAGSETPPEGPPWVRDFHEARATALERNVPVFVYLTKTH